MQRLAMVNNFIAIIPTEAFYRVGCGSLRSSLCRLSLGHSLSRSARCLDIGSVGQPRSLLRLAGSLPSRSLRNAVSLGLFRSQLAFEAVNNPDKTFDDPVKIILRRLPPCNLGFPRIMQRLCHRVAGVVNSLARLLYALDQHVNRFHLRFGFNGGSVKPVFRLADHIAKRRSCGINRVGWVVCTDYGAGVLIHVNLHQ